VGFLVMGLIAGVWLWLRQPETLPRDRRSSLSPRVMGAAAAEVMRHPVTIGYTLAVGSIFGSFICYLGTSQQIFAEQYDQGEYFAVWFGVFAVAIAIAMLQLILVWWHRDPALINPDSAQLSAAGVTCADAIFDRR